MASVQSGVRRGMVFDIQRWSLHDGPGIRTIVFLKGVRCGARGAATRSRRRPMRSSAFLPTSASAAIGGSSCPRTGRSLPPLRGCAPIGTFPAEVLRCRSGLFSLHGQVLLQSAQGNWRDDDRRRGHDRGNEGQ